MKNLLQLLPRRGGERAKTSVGIELGVDAVSVVALSQAEGGELQLLGMGSQALAEGAWGPRGIEDLDAVIIAAKVALAQVFGKRVPAACSVVMSLPASLLSSRRESMQHPCDEDAVQALLAERGESLFDGPLDSLCVDWVVGESVDGAPVPVDFWAAPRDAVMLLDDVAKGCGLSLAIVEREEVALLEVIAPVVAKRFPDRFGGATVGLVEFGRRESQFSVYQKGELTSRSRIRVAGGQLETASPEEAQALISNAVAQVGKQLRSYYSNFARNGTLDLLQVTGELAKRPDFLQELSAVVDGVPIEQAEPFGGMLRKKGVQVAMDASYVRACGLARRGLAG